MPRIHLSRILCPAFCLALTTTACGDDVLGRIPGTLTSTGTGTTTSVSSSLTPSSGDQSTTGEASTAQETSQGSSSTNGSKSSGSTASESDTQSSAPDYRWLEKPRDARVSAWVKATNEKSRPQLEAQPGFSDLQGKILNLVNAEPQNQLPAFSKVGDNVYSFHRDAANPRGIWRQMSYTDFKNNKANWEPLLNLDAMSETDKQPWTWLSPNCLEPAGERCMLNFVNTATNSGASREFDTVNKTFVRGDTFDLPEGFISTSWIDRDNIYVGANFGPGTTTKSGSPRTVRMLTRGMPLGDAPMVFQGEIDDAFVKVDSITSKGVSRVLATRGISNDERQYYLLDPKTHARTRLGVPSDSTVRFWGPWLICQLGDQDWSVGGETWEAGSVLVADQAAFVAGRGSFTRLFRPSSRRFLKFLETTQGHILVGAMENNKGRMYEWSYSSGTGWNQRMAELPKFGNFQVQALSPDDSEEYFLNYSDFLTPPTLFVGKTGSQSRTVLRSTHLAFDATHLEIQQFFATSNDGTKIPYFQVSKKGLVLDSKNPTIVFGVGGFGVPLTSGYRAGVGLGWLEKGGVFVLANIRGGGEFGPAWHQAALKGERQRSFDDFIAVGEDLVSRKVSSKAHMGAHGDGNGGLVAGVMMTQRPDLWGAIVAQNPILDMERFSVIAGGAPWIAEYGDPANAQDLKYLLEYSPYHQVQSGIAYPPLFLSTRTVNPQLSPAHARKMMARMVDQGHKDLRFYESTNASEQGGASVNERRAYNTAAIYTFFAKHLGL